MEPIVVAAVLTAILGSFSTLMTLWLREHRLRHQLREQIRRDHVRDLPPGSRIVDFGRGMLIDIGAQPDVEKGEHDRGSR